MRGEAPTFCPQCGTPAAPGYRFCTRCGNALTVAPVQSPATAGSAPDAAADVYGAFWPRACAFFIDYLLIVLICVFLRGLLGIRLENSVSIQFFFWATVLVLWLYKAVAERSTRQATLGKLAFDLKVTSLDGERIGLLRALVRNFAQILSGLIAFIGFLMPAFTRRHQALHDMCAGTLVVRHQYAPEVIEAASRAAPPSATPPVASRSAGVAPRPAPAVAVAGAGAPARREPVRRESAPRESAPREARRVPAPRDPRSAAKLARRAEPDNTTAGNAYMERVPSRPELPVRLSFKDALIGPDKRAVLENLSDIALEVVLDVKSPVTGAHFSRTFVINPRSFGQVGRAQGWPFAPGQLVTVSNPQYRSLVQTVN